MIDRSDAFARLRKAAVGAALHFNNAEVRSNITSGRKQEVRKKGFEIRDALIYRFQSLNFHEHFLHQLDQDSKETARREVPVRESKGFMRSMTLRQRFVFDDLVFGSMSAFDYLGSLVVVLMQGNANLKARWDKAYKWSKHSGAGRGGNRIHGTAVAELVVQEDEGWVKRLYDYRSEIIHYRTEKLDSRIQWTETIGNPAVLTGVDAYAPVGFVKSLKLDVDGEPLSIVAAAEHLMDRVYVSCALILEALETDPEARVPSWPPNPPLQADEGQ